MVPSGFLFEGMAQGACHVGRGHGMDPRVSDGKALGAAAVWGLGSDAAASVRCHCHRDKFCWYLPCMCARDSNMPTALRSLELYDSSFLSITTQCCMPLVIPLAPWHGVCIGVLFRVT